MEKKRITFGRYPQSGGEPEPIRWLVLAEEGDALFCLSEAILDCRPYHREGGAVCWKDCSLRRWLGGAFLAAAFSPEEQARLLPTPLQSPGGETVDKVFLPAPPADWPGYNMMEDPDDYYGFPPEDCALTTPYARAQGAWFVEEEGPEQYRGSWCIRYPRYLDDGETAADYTSSVNFDGYIEAAAQDTASPDGIRPAVRLPRELWKEKTP